MNSGDFDPQEHIWDAAVIGTGAGGATTGFAIARRGRSVLFLERGKSAEQGQQKRGVSYVWDGNAESALEHGWWPEPLRRTAGPAAAASHHPLGAGTGGSTALFGMVMDRLRPQDFTPRAWHRAAADTTLPEHWPVSYDDLDPYYAEAERLYRVRGTPDPLGPAGALLPPPPVTAKESAVTGALESCGLHPYRIHYAQDRTPECQGCAAMLCPRECRNDAARICLRPAVAQHAARVLTECRVVRLEARGRTVGRAICEWRGQRIVVRARVFVLAANAFITPALLQRSANEQFPEGLANSSGLVGRNLMLHVSDFLLLSLKGRANAVPPEVHHGLSMNDFYLRDGLKMGNVHMHAVPVTREMTLSFMRLHMKWARRLPRAAMGPIAAVASLAARRSLAFATIVEDLPYLCNRVTARPGNDDTVDYEYRYPHELRVRSWSLFLQFKQQVAPRFSTRLLRPPGMLNLSHVCGTCRAGRDPRTSVLDSDNRAHDLDNLYVTDASFFPSSGGINPSLTIAANSLRVGASIAARL